MKKKHILILCLVVLLGIALRAWNLTAVSLWHDEAFSALLIKYSFGEMMYRIGLDVHPPMYYIFLRFWHYIFSDSLASLRGFSLLFGTLIIPLSYFFTEKISKSKLTALIAATFVAVNAFQIQYVSEARMYTMGAFFALLSAYSLTRSLNDGKQTTKSKIMWTIIFGISSGIAILTHYYLLFSIAAICGYGVLYVLVRKTTDWKKYLQLILSFGIIAGGFLLYLPTFLYQYKQVGAGYWIPPIDRWSIPTTVWQILTNYPLDLSKLSTKIALLFIVALIVYAIINVLRKTKFDEKWLIVFGFLAPFAGSLAFALLAKLKGSDSSVYLVRYFLYASPFLAILLAIWISNFKKVAYAKILSAIYVVFCVYSVWYHWDQDKPFERRGMQAASEYLHSNVKINQKIFVGSNFEFFNYKYYNSRAETKTPATPLLFTGGRNVSQMAHFEGTAILTNDDLVPDFKKATVPGDTVWLLWTDGFGGKLPEIPSNWTLIGNEQKYPDTKPYVGTNIYIHQYTVTK